MTLCGAWLQDAIWQAAELVMDGAMGTAKARLPARVAAESGGDAELMFGPALEGAASTEADAWLVCLTQTLHAAQFQVDPVGHCQHCSCWLHLDFQMGVVLSSMWRSVSLHVVTNPFPHEPSPQF